MKLYLSRGSIWTGTQADAKAAQGDNSYETVEVPTDKPNLMGWLNDHWSKAVQNDTARFDPTDVTESRYDDEESEESEQPAPPPKPKKTHHNGFCLTCGRSEVGHHLLKQGDIQTAIIEGIDQIDQAWALNGIAEAIEERGTKLGLTPLDG